jgi:hypothetical protein
MIVHPRADFGETPGFDLLGVGDGLLKKIA